MTTSCFALWIPTRKAGKITPVASLPKRKKIQDNPEYKPYFIWGEVDENALHFTLLYHTTDSRADAKRLFFKCKGHNRHGFIIYSTDFPDEICNDPFLTTLKENGLSPSVYNFIKEHYHEHTHHDSSEDALLLCPCLDKETDLNTAVPKIASHYLDLYEEKFKNLLKDIKMARERAGSLANNNMSLFKGISMYDKTLRRGRIKVGEFEYCKFLMQEYGTGKKQQKQAITDTMNAIHRELEAASFEYQLCTNGYNIKLAILGIWVGATGCLISAGGTIYSICHGPELPDSNERVLSTVIEEERGVSREVQLLHGKVDSLIQVGSQPAADSVQASAGK